MFFRVIKSIYLPVSTTLMILVDRPSQYLLGAIELGESRERSKGADVQTLRVLGIRG
jgi:hypothetical protein